MDSFSKLILYDGESALAAITGANEETAESGLVLSAEQAKSLCEVYNSAIAENGIVEFGAGGVVKIQKAFAKSDFVDRGNFAEVVEAMTESFYYIKREVEDEIRDDAVIAAMLDAFDNHSMGSIELFQSRDAEILIRYLNEGRSSLEIADDGDYNGYPEDYWGYDE